MPNHNKISARELGSYGPWEIKNSSTAYSDPFVTVEVDQVIQPDKQPGQHVVVFMKPGVCVLPIDHERNVYLTQEFHYGIGEESIEGVSGGREPRGQQEGLEAPLVTAQRELAEELGLAAENWNELTTLNPFTTIVVSPTVLFVATGLSPVPSSPEGTEQIETVKVSLATAKEWVLSGKISHAPTCVLLLIASDQIDSLL